jgi:hypothetical protein
MTDRCILAEAATGQALALWSGPSSERKAPPTTGPIGDVAAFCDAV